MREKLKNHYLKFGPRPFVAFTVLSLLVLDLLNGYYLKQFWIKKSFANMIVHRSILQGGLLIEDLSPSTLNEMTGFVSNIFYFLLFLILVNNLFFYFFYLRKKLWAQGYVLFYTLTAAIMSLTFLFDDAELGMGWFAFNLSTVPMYLYLFLGVKLLKAETTLEDEKKEQ